MSTPWRASVCLLAAAVLAGCASKPNRAPVEDRSPGERPTTGAAPAPSEAPPKPLPGAENAGKPGYYTVRPGDTLIRIGLENGQSARDLVRWNALVNPNLIEVGQVLRVVPPGVDPAAASSRPVTTARVETRTLDARPAPAPAPAPAASGPLATSPPLAASAPPLSVPAPAPAPAPAREADDDIKWGWPANGPTIGTFDESKVKGLDLGGKAGDPVYAAADGRVVYVGSALRGYGNLIILKHNTTYLTAYAHNQSILVKDDQVVRRGQKIAEMGSSDADSVRLHFEIRKQGKPIDPARLLPAR